MGGVARLDVLAAPAATIYITLWASADLVTHFGKTDVAGDKCDPRLLLLCRSVCLEPWCCASASAGRAHQHIVQSSGDCSCAVSTPLLPSSA